MGKNLSLDEACLSNGVYTILTNKAAHGRKGAIVAIVKRVASDVVSAIFKILPHKSRIQVQTITTDLSSAMMLTARRCFPAAKLINDRFHVQQLMADAVDQIRIGLRWQILDEENKKIKEHRLKRKDAKTKSERERIGLWTPIRMSNGETMPHYRKEQIHYTKK